MDSYVDREMERQIPARQARKTGKQGDRFNRMLALSVLLHLVFIVYITSPGGGRSHPPVVTFDLKDIALPTPPSALSEPTPDTPPQPPETATEPLPEVPLPESQQLAKAMEQALAQAPDTPELLQESSLGLGLSRGYFNSLAEGKSLRGDIRVYYFDILRRLNEVWWTRGVQGMNPGKREALVNLEISRDGILLRRDLIRSTGDRQLDRAILSAIDGASPFPPLPDSYEDRVFSAPLRLAAPLHLFSLTD